MPEIAIDACVFINLFDTRKSANEDGHVDMVLSHYLLKDYQLLVDSTGKIGLDFKKIIIPILTGASEEGTQLTLLRQWMMPERHQVVDLQPTDLLMRAIRSVIYEPSESPDRAFVYVACKNGTDLISNDEIHILGRRGDLLKAAKKAGYKSTEIVSSKEAYEGIA